MTRLRRNGDSFVHLSNYQALQITATQVIQSVMRILSVVYRQDGPKCNKENQQGSQLNLNNTDYTIVVIDMNKVETLNNRFLSDKTHTSCRGYH